MAKLCTLRLLQQLDSSEVAQGLVKCMAFAAPALGNAHLAQLVEQQGWSHVFYNLTLPGELHSCACCALSLGRMERMPWLLRARHGCLPAQPLGMSP